MSIKAVTHEQMVDLVVRLTQGESIDSTGNSLGMVPFGPNQTAVASIEITQFVNEQLKTSDAFKKIKEYIGKKISGEKSYLHKKITKILNANIPSPLHPHIAGLPQNQNSLDLLFKTISQANQYTDENLISSAIYQYGKIAHVLFSQNISEEKHSVHLFLLEILLKRHGLSSVQTDVFYTLARIYLNTESIASQKVLQSFVYADGDPYLKLFCLDLFEAKNAMTSDDLATFRVSALSQMLISDKEGFKEDQEKLSRLNTKVFGQADYLSLSESKYVEGLLKENRNIHVLKKAMRVYLFHQTYSIYLDGAIQKLKNIIPPEILKLSLLQNTLTGVIAQVKAEVGILRKRSSKISEIKTEKTNDWFFEIKNGEIQFGNKLKDFEALNHQMLLFASTQNENIGPLRQKLAENIALYRDLMHKKFKQYDEDFDLLVKDTLTLEDNEYTEGNHFRNYLKLTNFIREKFDELYHQHIDEIESIRNSNALAESKFAEVIFIKLKERKYEFAKKAMERLLDESVFSKKFIEILSLMTEEQYIKNSEKMGNKFFRYLQRSTLGDYIKTMKAINSFLTMLFRDQRSFGMAKSKYEKNYRDDSIDKSGYSEFYWNLAKTIEYQWKAFNDFQTEYFYYFEKTKSVINTLHDTYAYHAYDKDRKIKKVQYYYWNDRKAGGYKIATGERYPELQTIKHPEIQSFFIDKGGFPTWNETYNFDVAKRYESILKVINEIVLSPVHKSNPSNGLNVEYDRSDLNQAKRALAIREFADFKKSLAELSAEIKNLSVKIEVLFKNENVKIIFVANKFDQSIKISGTVKIEKELKAIEMSKKEFLLKLNPETKTVHFSKKIDLKADKVDMALLYADLLKLVNSFR